MLLYLFKLLNPTPFFISQKIIKILCSRLCCILVCCFICLVIKSNSFFISQKNYKNPLKEGLNLRLVGIEGATFTTKPIKLLCSYDTYLFIYTDCFFSLSDLMGPIPMIRHWWNTSTYARGAEEPSREFVPGGYTLV